MHILQTDNDICYKKFGFSFVKETFVAKMISQISSIKVVHNKIQMLAILKGISHVNQERVI